MESKTPDLALLASDRLRFRYLLFELEKLAPMLLDFDPTDKPDAYLSEDGDSKRLAAALKEGYRWTQTAGPYAIFEKVRIVG